MGQPGPQPGLQLGPHPGPHPGEADTIARLFVAPPSVSRDAAWPRVDGSLLDERGVTVPAFPLDLLPLLWRTWITDTARSVNVPADYVAQAVLAAVAGICGAGVWVHVSSVWSDPLSLWLAVVGAPSSGKSPALASVRQLLGTLEREPAAAVVEPGSLGPAHRPPRIVGHGGVEALVETAMANQRGVILWRDEPAGCFAPLVAGGAVRALDPFPVTILGSLEPEQLAAMVKRSEEGLAARFLYAWPAPPPFQPLAGRTPADDGAALSMLRAIRRKAGTIGDPLVLGLDEGGLAALDGFLAGLHAELRAVEGIEAAWLGKGRGVVPRLAGVLHLLDWSAAQSVESSAPLADIGRETIERAVALWSGYFRPHAKAFFDRVAPCDLDARARRVVRWLKSCGADEVTREDVRRTALGQTVNASEADRVLARLTEAGVLRLIPQEKPLQRGRPAMRWAVNTGLRTS